MPFEKGARIEIENQSDRNIDAFYFYVDYLEMDKLPKDMADSMRGTTITSRRPFPKVKRNGAYRRAETEYYW